MGLLKIIPPYTPGAGFTATGQMSMQSTYVGGSGVIIGAAARIIPVPCAFGNAEPLGVGSLSSKAAPTTFGATTTVGLVSTAYI